MKRLFLTVIAVLGAAVTFAGNGSINAVDKADIYNMDVNYLKLAESLGLTHEQLESVQYIHNKFCTEMATAGGAAGEGRRKLVDKALKKDVRYMHHVLTKEQYRKYLMILNATFNNRGLDR